MRTPTKTLIQRKGQGQGKERGRGRGGADADQPTPNPNADFSAAELVRCIRDAALSVSAVTLDDSVRLSASRALFFFFFANSKSENKKRSASQEEAQAAEEAAASSVKRRRKKSKYLSPPYTDTDTTTTTDTRGREPLPLPNQPQPEPENLDKRDHLLTSEVLSVRDLLNDFLSTALDPLYLKWKRSAKLLRLFFHRYRDTIFVQGKGADYGSCYSNHIMYTSESKLKGKVAEFKADLDSTSIAASRVKEEEPEREAGKDKTDSGSHQPNTQGRPTKQDKVLSSSGSNMPPVEQSEQKHERKDLTGSVSSVTFNKTNNSIGPGTNGSYEFLEEARAQMMKTSSLENGTKLAGTGKQPQEHGSSKKCNTGNTDGTSDTGPRQRGRKKKIPQVHYPNPAALLLDFSKWNTTSGTATSTGMNLPSRDQLLSTFSTFGLLVEAQSDVHPDARTANVVFARSADAETAYNSPDKLGPFGPPYASCRLRYLPPISDPTTPAQRAQAHKIPAQPSAKPQLSDIRKNLEIMISSLTGGSGLPVKQEPGTAFDGIQPEVRGNLLGEMRGLLMKVEKRLGGSGASSCGPQP